MQDRMLSTQYCSSINCGTVAADRIARQRIIDRQDAGLHWYVKHASVRPVQVGLRPAPCVPHAGRDIDQRGATGVGPEQL